LAVSLALLKAAAGIARKGDGLMVMAMTRAVSINVKAKTPRIVLCFGRWSMIDSQLFH